MTEMTYMERKFASKVRKSGECWEWVGEIMHRGYGMFWHKQKWRAHRASWFLANGPIPDGLLVLHHCDNRKCVKPDHLFLGTAQDNSTDMVNKGRSARTGFKGELHPQAKLTGSDVRLIKSVRGFKNAELGKIFDVHSATIHSVLSGHSWGHTV